MNSFYLVLPLADYNAAVNESACLREISELSSSFSFSDYLQFLAKAFYLVSSEHIVVYYDHHCFLQLYKKFYSKVEKRKRPNVLQLLSSFPTLKNIGQLQDKMKPVLINNVEQNGGLLCAFVNFSSDADAIVDSGIVRDPATLQINAEGNFFPLNLIKADKAQVFKWYANHRIPPRMLTSTYEKHTDNLKGSKEKPISPCSYSPDEGERLLQWAKGKNGHNRYYFQDVERGRLVIFWHQNEVTPMFHIYDVDIEDNVEVQKMWKEMGRKGVNMIRDIANIYYNK